MLPGLDCFSLNVVFFFSFLFVYICSICACARGPLRSPIARLLPLIICGWSFGGDKLFGIISLITVLNMDVAYWVCQALTLLLELPGVDVRQAWWLHCPTCRNCQPHLQRVRYHSVL